MRIRQFRDEDFDAVLKITLLAFAPIHESFHNILGDQIFNIVYPDWRESYRQYLKSLTRSQDKENFLVAEENDLVIGYIVYSMNADKKFGELGLNAVHPDHQNKGVGFQMYESVLTRMKEQGIALVEVSTGGYFSHAPARRAYEKCGFTPLPLVRYYKAV